MRDKDPIFAALLDSVKGPRHTRSLVSGEFIPTEKGYHEEMDRVESLIGRYTIGFRHYENYENYRVKYPDRTIEDYIEDINSQMTFDEWHLLCIKTFLYEAKHDPNVIYEYGLDRIAPGTPDYE